MPLLPKSGDFMFGGDSGFILMGSTKGEAPFEFEFCIELGELLKVSRLGLIWIGNNDGEVPIELKFCTELGNLMKGSLSGLIPRGDCESLLKCCGEVMLEGQGEGLLEG